jgi:hypothetical protein
MKNTSGGIVLIILGLCFGYYQIIRAIRKKETNYVMIVRGIALAIISIMIGIFLLVG